MFGFGARRARSGRTLRYVIVSALLSSAVALVCVAPAAAKPPPAPNGQILFSRQKRRRSADPVRTFRPDRCFSINSSLCPPIPQLSGFRSEC
jgi:hypothetical protein